MKHDIDAIIRKWQTNLDLLVKEYHFGIFLHQPDLFNFYKWYDIAQEQKNLNSLFEFHNGATRVVISDNEMDYVVKIQFKRNDGIDFCGGEAAVYACAEENHLGKFFAWSTKLFNYNFEYEGKFYECVIYAMEYCDVNEYENEQGSYDFQYHLYCLTHGYDESDPKVARDFGYGCSICDDEEDMKQYAEFLWDEDLGELWEFLDAMKVDDLHSGNWGFIDDHFVICDYAGYSCQVGCV